MKTNLKVVAVALTTGVALGALTGLSSCQRQQESALKPIDKAALQTMVDTTARGPPDPRQALALEPMT
jgi:hypothetical protein